MARSTNSNRRLRNRRRSWNRAPLLVSAACAVFQATGCGQSEFDLAPVTGQVTLDGKPFAWGSVMFAPAAKSAEGVNSGKPAFGLLDADGRFELGTYDERDGAVVGDHRVTVFRVDDGPNGPADQWVPAFRRVAVQGESFVVKPSGDNEFDIDLSSDKIRRHAVD